MRDPRTVRTLGRDQERLTENDADRDAARLVRAFGQTFPRTCQPDGHDRTTGLLRDEARARLRLGEDSGLDPGALRIDDQRVACLEQVERSAKRVSVRRMPDHWKCVVLPERKLYEATSEVLRLGHVP